MTMDPELAEIVRLAGAAPVLPLDRNAVGAFRELSRVGMLAYGEGPKLAKVEDRTVPGPRGSIPVRVYHPDGEPVGVLVFFHGSGFVICDLDTHDRECRLLARGAGIVVV